MPAANAIILLVMPPMTRTSKPCATSRSAGSNLRFVNITICMVEGTVAVQLLLLLLLLLSLLIPSLRVPLRCSCCYCHCCCCRC